MIVVAVIAIVAALAMPAWQRSRKRAQADVLMNEMRVTGDAFQSYVAEKGNLPPSASGFSEVPPGMDIYLPKKSTWTTVAAGGGYWSWQNFAPSEVWGFSGVIGIYNPDFDSSQLAQIDTVMDDGDPGSGGIRTTAEWVFLGVK